MAISFSRSMRSLQSDSFRPSLATLIVASVLIVAWFAWLVFASVTLYESSSDWELQRDGSLVVRFTEEAVARLRPGQRATLEVQVIPNQPPVQLQAMVADTPSRTQNRLAPDTVKVSLLAGPLPATTTSGTVKIAVETVTPLTLITRAANQVTGAK
jgi:hypothetical protein